MNKTEHAIREYMKTIRTQILDAAHPVGSYYISDYPTDPAELFGGTWERVTGRFLLAATDGGASGGNSRADIVAGGTGGEATHTLGTSEIPAHTHGSKSLTGTWYATGVANATVGTSGIVSHSAGNTVNYTGNSSNARAVASMEINASHEHTSVGGGGAHNNMPPYLAVYVWKRTG